MLSFKLQKTVTAWVVWVWVFDVVLVVGGVFCHPMPRSIASLVFDQAMLCRAGCLLVTPGNGEKTLVESWHTR